MAKLLNHSERLFKHLPKLFKLLVNILVFSGEKSLKNSAAWIFEYLVNKNFFVFIHWKITWLFLIYILPLTFVNVPWGTAAVWFQPVTLTTYVKYLNSDLITNVWKKRKKNKKWRMRELNLFKVKIWTSAKSSRFFDECRRVYMPFIDQIFKNTQCFLMTKKLTQDFVSK